MSSDCNASLNFCDESFSQKNCFGRGVKESFIIVSFDETLSKCRLTLSHVIIGLWSDKLFGSFTIKDVIGLIHWLPALTCFRIENRVPLMRKKKNNNRLTKIHLITQFYGISDYGRVSAYHWTKKRICPSLLVEQIYCKFRVLVLLLICSWCKFCSKVKVYFSIRAA